MGQLPPPPGLIQYRQEQMLSALIAELLSTTIRQRLLEQRDLLFQDAYDKARTQELAYKNSKAFQHSRNCQAATDADVTSQKEDNAGISTAKRTSNKSDC